MVQGVPVDDPDGQNGDVLIVDRVQEMVVDGGDAGKKVFVGAQEIAIFFRNLSPFHGYQFRGPQVLFPVVAADVEGPRRRSHFREVIATQVIVDIDERREDERVLELEVGRGRPAEGLDFPAADAQGLFQRLPGRHQGRAFQ